MSAVSHSSPENVRQIANTVRLLTSCVASCVCAFFLRCADVTAMAVFQSGLSHSCVSVYWSLTQCGENMQDACWMTSPRDILQPRFKLFSFSLFCSLRHSDSLIVFFYFFSQHYITYMGHSTGILQNTVRRQENDFRKICFSSQA